MKRLFVVASMAIMAVGCQKTTVENEVLTPIGFNTEVGKQTRAIIEGTTYADTSKFGVYAFGHQGQTTTPIMQNVEIGKIGDDWKATGTTKYYWPNDADTYINFYAYSPKGIHAQMATEGTMTLTAYEHTNFQGEDAIDFMTAVPVEEEKYGTHNGVVPVAFHHQMSQVQFVVKNSMTDANVTFKLVSITLNNVVNKADYSNAYATNYGTWTNGATGSYTLFDNADGVIIDADGTNTKTTAATMIPQTLVASTTPAPAVLDGSHFTVVYKISGTGVATEEVEKSIDLKKGTLEKWEPNKKIIYTLTVDLEEITFNPTVVDWATPAVESGEISIL